jgi:hypothetical protein
MPVSPSRVSSVWIRTSSSCVESVCPAAVVNPVRPGMLIRPVAYFFILRATRTMSRNPKLSDRSFAVFRSFPTESSPRELPE